MLIFYRLNENKDGWYEAGRIKDGEIISDETGSIEYLLEGKSHYPEEYLAKQFNNHYINAVLVEDDAAGTD